MLTQKQFKGLIETFTNKTLNIDYTIDIGTNVPFAIQNEGLFSSSSIEGFEVVDIKTNYRLRINDFSQPYFEIIKQIVDFLNKPYD